MTIALAASSGSCVHSHAFHPRKAPQRPEDWRGRSRPGAPVVLTGQHLLSFPILVSPAVHNLSCTSVLQLGIVPCGSVQLRPQPCCLHMTPSSMWTHQVVAKPLSRVCWSPKATSSPGPKDRIWPTCKCYQVKITFTSWPKPKGTPGPRTLKSKRSLALATFRRFANAILKGQSALSNLGSGGQVLLCWAFILAASWQPLSTGWRIFSKLNLRLFAP